MNNAETRQSDGDNLRRFMLAYGMLAVLLALCGFFAVATYHQETPVGQEGGESLAADILARQPRPASVAIVVTPGDSDKEFADAVEKKLAQEHVPVLARVAGNPPDAREELEKLASVGKVPDVVATTVQTRDWAVWNALKTQFPAYAHAQILAPTGGKRSTFLSAGNLRNIADQIAVIAILAVGMTLVILTGGIDLSVGSLIALSAVATAWLIHAGGGVNASPGVMFGASLAAIGLSGAVGCVFRPDDYPLWYSAVYCDPCDDAGGERTGVHHHTGPIPVRYFALVYLDSGGARDCSAFPIPSF